MKTPCQIKVHGQSNVVWGFSFFVLIFLARFTFAAEDQDQPTPARTGTQIECTTPDGRVIAVPTATNVKKETPALLTDEETLSCRLQEGETTFVIKLPAVPMSDRFTFVNENAAAAGELKIAVSKDELPAASAQWIDVGGHIAFNHKRLFNVSTVGVDARYLKLSFNVAKGDRLAATSGREDHPAGTSSLSAEEIQALASMARAMTAAR